MKDFPVHEIIIDHSDLEIVPALPVPGAAFEQQYPDAVEEIDPNIPQAFGPPLQTFIFFDSDLRHDLRTHRSCTGLVVFVG